jgi:hypothetical protein
MSAVPFGGLAIFLLALSGPSLASAQSERVDVLTPRIEPALSQTERASALQALERALQDGGMQPAPARADTCEREPCAEGAPNPTQLAVQLTIWRATTHEGAGGASVALTQPDGTRYSEGVVVSAGNEGALAIAIAAATRGALERYRRGPGPWLELDGAPPGSSIAVDGEPLGTVPGRYRVAGGLHHVVVSAAGYASYDATVTVPRNPDGYKHVEVDLAPATDAGDATLTADPEPRASRVSPLNYAIGGAAVVLGGVLAIRPVRTIAEDGDCGRTESGRCTGVVALDAGTGVQLGAAALFLAGGVAFAIWAPLRVQATPESARAELTLRF